MVLLRSRAAEVRPKLALCIKNIFAPRSSFTTQARATLANFGLREACEKEISRNYSKSSSAVQKRNHRRSTPPPALIQNNSLVASDSRTPPKNIVRLTSIVKRENYASSTFPVKYEAPQTGLLSILPKSWVPYAELIRLDKPTGTYYLYFPCLFSTLIAAPFTIPMVTPTEVAGKACLFFAGALIMRGAGCAINDLWDKDLDPHVARTKFRPIARGALLPQNAILFTGFQLLAGLGILLQFPTQCLWYGIPSLLLVATYPLAKRVTDYPQLILGFTFSWGAIMGFPALGMDLMNHTYALSTAAALYSSCVAWAVLYDMIYAHMDIRDDVSVGIRSIALRHEHNTKGVLSGLAVAQVALLALAGASAGSGPIFFIGSCGGAALSLGVMIWRVRLKEVENCWWWFKNGCWITGFSITLGLVGDYLVQWLREQEEQENGHKAVRIAELD
jgi:4-hydroxybenzoate polyprenyltransferase